MSEENISVKTLVTKDMTREDLYYYAKHLEEREAELLNINNKLQKKAELGEHYKHLYSEVKKQKDELETSYGILQKNNTTLVKQKEEAYKIADDYYKENQQLKKQKDDVVEYIKTHDLFDRNYDDKKAKNELLRMLGEIE